MLTPKGNATKKTWQCLSRNIDVADKIVKNRISPLNLQAKGFVRTTRIENDVIVWCSHLRHFRYLHTTRASVYNINGDTLSNIYLLNIFEII